MLMLSDGTCAHRFASPPKRLSTNALALRICRYSTNRLFLRCKQPNHPAQPSSAQLKWAQTQRLPRPLTFSLASLRLRRTFVCPLLLRPSTSNFFLEWSCSNGFGLEALALLTKVGLTWTFRFAMLLLDVMPNYVIHDDQKRSQRFCHQVCRKHGRRARRQMHAS